MPKLLLLLPSLLCLTYCQILNHSLPIHLPHPPLNASCPLIRDHISRGVVRETLDDLQQNRPCSTKEGSWTRAVHLDMSDMNQQCPSNWTLITTPIRGCGRTNDASEICDSVIYPVYGRTYSHVRGKILALQKGRMSAFHNALWLATHFLDDAYLSGVSLTHGQPGSRHHIWSFVGGLNELDDGRYTAFKCPCSTTNWPHQVPSFINDDYFCDSGNPDLYNGSNTYYIDDPLWDGKGCQSSSTCCEFKSPPWFCISLSEPTNEDLEIRNCYTHSSGFEDNIIILIDIYVK